MPIIRVEMLKGRSRDQKRELVKELTDAFERATGSNTANLQVVISDVEKENWGSGGTIMADKLPD